MLAANNSLRTRVSELEVINHLFRGRVAELEHQLKMQKEEALHQPSESKYRQALEESQRREAVLKRRVDELEQELSDIRDSSPQTKKMRLSDIVDDALPSTPQSTTA
jgi:GATA-binding protein